MVLLWNFVSEWTEKLWSKGSISFLVDILCSSKRVSACIMGRHGPVWIRSQPQIPSLGLSPSLHLFHPSLCSHMFHHKLNGEFSEIGLRLEEASGPRLKLDKMETPVVLQRSLHSACGLRPRPAVSEVLPVFYWPSSYCGPGREQNQQTKSGYSYLWICGQSFHHLNGMPYQHHCIPRKSSQWGAPAVPPALFKLCYVCSFSPSTTTLQENKIWD